MRNRAKFRFSDVHQLLAEGGWGQSYGVHRGRPYIRLSIHPSRHMEHAQGFVRATSSAALLLFGVSRRAAKLLLYPAGPMRRILLIRTPRHIGNQPETIDSFWVTRNWVRLVILLPRWPLTDADAGTAPGPRYARTRTISWLARGVVEPTAASLVKTTAEPCATSCRPVCSWGSPVARQSYSCTRLVRCVEFY